MYGGENMKDNKIIYLKDAQKKKLKDAYNWALSEQKRLGFFAQPIQLNFDEGDALTHDKKVYVSVFVDEDSKRVLMRRDWDEDLTVQYNVIVNYDEIKNVAPNSLNELLNNGIKLYERYNKI